MLLNTITRFSYCMETIIQAGNKKLRIDSVPVVTNAKTRESRLFKSTRQHVFKSGGRDHPRVHHVQAVHHLRLVGGRVRRARARAVRAVGRAVGLGEPGGGHLQSLLIGAVLLIMSFLSVMLGIVSDLIRTNRILIEDTLEHTRRARFATSVETEPTWPRAVPS